MDPISSDLSQIQRCETLTFESKEKVPKEFTNETVYRKDQKRAGLRWSAYPTRSMDDTGPECKTIEAKPSNTSKVFPKTKDVLLDHLQAVVMGLAPHALQTIMPILESCEEHHLCKLLSDQNYLLTEINEMLHQSANYPKFAWESKVKHGSLGYQLFSRVIDIEIAISEQITGMILKTQPGDINHLLENRDALERAVIKARCEFIMNHYPDLLPKEEDIAERLFKIVQETHAENASRITGMLLEMEWYFLQHLLTKPAELKLCIEKAAKVLQDHNNNQNISPK